MTTTPNNEPNATRHPSQWLALDATGLREVLAYEMAAWLARGYFSRYRADRFDRYARRLAALAQADIDQVYRDLRADGLAILEERGEQPHYIFRQ